MLLLVNLTQKTQNKNNKTKCKCRILVSIDVPAASFFNVTPTSTAGRPNRMADHRMAV